MLRDLHDAWKLVTPLDFNMERIETEPQFLQIMAPTEAVVAVAIEIRIGDAVGMMNIAMPSIIIKMMRQKFDQQWLLRKAASTEAEQMRVMTLIESAELQAEAVLSGPNMLLRDLIDLAEGDVLGLEFPVTRSLDLLLSGGRKYRGEVVHSGSRAAFRVTERCESRSVMTISPPQSPIESRVLGCRAMADLPKIGPNEASNMCMVSPWLGEICWQEGCELQFPAGLPGFEQQRRMVPIEIPSQRPLIYLQSAEHVGVCFVALPVLTVSPGFQLRLSEDDRSLLEFDPLSFAKGDSPALGTDVLCLALLVPSGRTVQTNLDAPIVINLHNSRGIQAVSAAPAAGSYRLSEAGGWEALC